MQAEISKGTAFVYDLESLFRCGSDTIFTATPEQIPQRVTEVFRQFLATNFPVRVKAIANQIISKKPDIIGLQEAELWQLFVPNLPTVTYDFVDIIAAK